MNEDSNCGANGAVAGEDTSGWMNFSNVCQIGKEWTGSCRIASYDRVSKLDTRCFDDDKSLLRNVSLLNTLLFDSGEFSMMMTQF